MWQRGGTPSAHLDELEPEANQRPPPLIVQQIATLSTKALTNCIKKSSYTTRITFHIPLLVRIWQRGGTPSAHLDELEPESDKRAPRLFV